MTSPKVGSIERRGFLASLLAALVVPWKVPKKRAHSHLTVTRIDRDAKSVTIEPCECTDEACDRITGGPAKIGDREYWFTSHATYERPLA